MNTDRSYEWRRQLVWGLVIVGFGLVLFLDNIDVVQVEHLWHYAPLVLVVVGMNKMVGYPTARHFSAGLWEMFIGLWLFAVFEHMYGLTFFNSWPLVIIAIGVKIAIEPMIRSRFAPNGEDRHEK